MQTRTLSVVVLTLALTLTSASAVLAIDATSSTSTRQDKIEAKKTVVQGEKEEKVASRSAALLLKLKTFKDKKKADKVEKIDAQLDTINQNASQQMLKFLDKASEILSKLEERVGKVTGKDTTTATTAITEAQTAISAAKTAATLQSTKDYTVNATSEAKIKDDVKSTRDKEHTDLKATRELVVAAKQSVSKAISTAVSSLGGK